MRTFWIPIAGLGLSIASAHAAKVDVHSHARVSSASASASELANLMTSQNIGYIFMMPTPAALPSEYDEGEDSEDLVAALGANPKIKFFYGGTELNPILHSVGRTEDWTIASVYPNGVSDEASAQAGIDEALEIAAASSDWETEFKSRATSAATSGRYLGFGELAPLHYSQRSDHPYIRFSASHDLMLWLSDLAQAHGMVLDVHAEITTATSAELATLLAHNASTKIILDHAGWSTYGTGTAAALSALLAAYPNLYLSLKGCQDLSADSAACYLDSAGVVRSDWYTLLTTYSSRIMVGLDAKYWEDRSGLTPTVSETMTHYASDLATLMPQLPAAVKAMIKGGTASALFGL